MKVSELLKAGLESYTGRKVSNLKTFKDPKVDGAYALRVNFEKFGDEIFDFLVTNLEGGMSPDDVAELVEETDYTEWPPKVGNPKFF